MRIIMRFVLRSHDPAKYPITSVEARWQWMSIRRHTLLLIDTVNGCAARLDVNRSHVIIVNGFRSSAPALSACIINDEWKGG